MDKNNLKSRLHKDLMEWMDQHKRADELVFSEVSGYPVKAIYYFPFGKYAEDELETLAKENPAIAKAIEMTKQKVKPL